MSIYTPDVWVVIEFTTPKETIRKVLAGWYGGFGGSNSWKLNSGITEVRYVDGFFEFDGYSGSTYRCHENSCHMSSLMHSVYGNWKKEIEEEEGYSVRILSIDEVAQL